MPEVSSFAEIEAEFLSRVRSLVWCSVATIDRQGRPRSRILHPIWEGSTGWIGTRRHSFKERHLARNPHMSLAYVPEFAKAAAGEFNPVYVDCRADWEDDPATKRRVWDLFRTTPPPVGYDPEPIFKGADHPEFGLLRLTPWRIELPAGIPPSIVWRAASA